MYEDFPQGNLSQHGNNYWRKQFFYSRKRCYEIFFYPSLGEHIFFKFLIFLLGILQIHGI